MRAAIRARLRAAASSASVENDDSNGRSVAPPTALWRPARRRAPVSRSRPGVGLISMFSAMPLRRQRAMAASEGSGSPGVGRRVPRARRRAATGRAKQRVGAAAALVVRSSVASCSRKGTPSAQLHVAFEQRGSRALAPRRKAASVFSGASLPAPRCAIQARIRPGASWRIMVDRRRWRRRTSACRAGSESSGDRRPTAGASHAASAR